MPTPGKLTWQGGRLILELDVTIRVPVELEPIAKRFHHGLDLTKREQQALAGILKGCSNKELANDMHLSERTIKFHVSHLLRKFKVPTRGELQALFGKQRSGDDRA